MKHPFLRNFFITYIVVLLISILPSTLVYWSWIESAQKTAISRNESNILKAMDTIDMRMNELNNTIQFIANSPSVNNLFNIGKDLSGSSDIYKIYVADKIITDFNYSNTLEGDFYIFYRDSDIVLSPNKSTITDEFYYGKLFQYEEKSYDEWRNILFSSFYNRNILPQKNIYKNNNTYEVIPYIQSIPLLNISYNAKAVIVYFIYTSSFYDVLSYIDTGSEGYVMITNEQNDVILDTKSISAGMAPINLPKKQSGYFFRSIDGQKMLVNWVTSPNTGWCYMAVVPTAYILREVTDIKSIITLVLVLSVISGLLSAFIFSSRKAKPLQDIFYLLFAKQKGNSYKSINQPLQYLHSNIEKILGDNLQLHTKNSSLSITLEKHYDMLYKSFLDKLMHDGFSNKHTIDEFIQLLEINITSPGYICGIIYIRNNSDTIDAQNYMKMDLMKNVTREILLEAFNDRILLRSIKNGYNMLILTETADPNIEQTKMVNTIRIISNELFFDRGISILCATGNLCYNLMNVHISWIEASQAIGIKEFSMDTHYISYQDAVNKGTMPYYPRILEEKLINLVQLGKITDVNSILNRIYFENFEKNKLSPAVAPLICQELIGTIIKTVVTRNKLMDIIHIQDEYAQINGLENQFEYLRNIMVGITQCYMENQKNIQMTMEKQILHYMDTYFNVPNINIESLATYLDKSSRYLYRYFKEEIGISFAEYLEKKRMDYAIHLLKETDELISNIAKKTGYNSSHAFRRAFKRVNGVLPMDYRSTCFNKVPSA